MEYGLIGEKLGHSFSKEVHNRLFDYDYTLKEIAREDLDAFMTARDFRAINVTIPYKQDVIPYLHKIDDNAEKIGAVNTVVNKGGKLYGYNTDFLGLLALIEKNGIELEGKKVLILGSGGTSKTAFAVAEHKNAREILRVSRTAREGGITYEDAYKYHSDAQIIINTTPCGMYPNIGESPIDIDKFDCLSGMVDAIYNPLDTALIVAAKRRGIKATGGLYMLVAQAAFAVELFLDIRLDRGKIDEVYNAIYQSKRNIVLIGMPGSGKTTVGKLLADSLGREFIDTDERIKSHERCEIADIFARVGEKGFRDIESQIIKQVASVSGAVIATGGGAVLREQNVNLLRGNSKIYFIDRPLEQITATPDRPLSSNREALEARYRERYPIYCAAADIKIDNLSDAQEAAEKIAKSFRICEYFNKATALNPYPKI